MPFSERKEILLGFSSVDQVVKSIDKDQTVIKTIKKLIKENSINIFANGGDRKNEEDIPEYSVCKKNGIVPKSTTRKIEETINQNDGKKSSNDDRQESLDFLKKKMLEYAENLNFEKAAEIRDKIRIKERKELGIKQNI